MKTNLYLAAVFMGNGSACRPNPCFYEADCIEDPLLPGGFKCSCEEGYTGRLCRFPGIFWNNMKCLVTRCNRPKRKAIWRAPPSCHCPCRSFQINFPAVVSSWQHCVQFKRSRFDFQNYRCRKKYVTV